MNFFKRKQMQDEWIVNSKNKIYAEIYLIVVAISVISFIVKYFIFKLPLSGVWTELLILLLSSMYYSIRATKLGIYAVEIELQDRESKWSFQRKNMLYALITGVAIAFGLGINSALRYADGMMQGMTYFFITFVVSMIIYLPLAILLLVVGNELFRRKSAKIASEMIGDDDEKS